MNFEKVISSIDNIVDKIPTSTDKMQLKNELTDLVMNALDTALAHQKEILHKELEGNFLQRSWRPITMLCFVFIIIYEYFLSSIFSLPKGEFPDKFLTLVEIGLGGYVFTRSVEKVATAVTNNIDYPFIKKRKRE